MDDGDGYFFVYLREFFTCRIDTNLRSTFYMMMIEAIMVIHHAKPLMMVFAVKFHRESRRSNKREIITNHLPTTDKSPFLIGRLKWRNWCHHNRCPLQTMLWFPSGLHWFLFSYFKNIIHSFVHSEVDYGMLKILQKHTNRHLLTFILTNHLKPNIFQRKKSGAQCRF